MEVDIALIAERKINDLNKRTEKLTHKLLAIESEKQQLQADNRRLTEEFTKLKHELEEADDNLENALKALQSANKEIEFLQEKVKEFQDKGDVSGSERHQMENLLKENKKLQVEVNRLSGKLSKSESLSQSYNEKLRDRNNLLSKENDALRNQLRTCTENLHETAKQCTSLTADLGALRIDLEDSNSKTVHYESKIRELEDRIRILTRENIKFRGHVKGYSSSKEEVHSFGKIISTDAFSIVPNELNSTFSKFEREEFVFGKIEKAAAEIIAHLFFEELLPLLGHVRADQLDDFRIACVRASFNLLQSTKYTEGNNEKEESFVAHLRKKKVLTKLVEEAIVGVKSLEDSSAIKKEILQMQKLLNDLELKIQNRAEQLKEKDNAINALQSHSTECRRQAEDSLAELEVLNARLQTGREELLKLDSELQLLKREVEISRVNLKESCALTEIESKSIDSARERLSALKYEQNEVETSIQRLKDQSLQEEIKLRSLKSSVSEQVRLFQIDLTKMQQEFKAKHKSLEDVNRRHQIQEEEFLLKQKELESKIALLRRDYDEEANKLSLLRDDFRSLNVEVDELNCRKRNAEFEIKSLQDKLEQEKLKNEKLDADYRRRYDGSQHELRENQDKLKQIKDAVTLARKEHASINQKIEEQRRNMNDVLRNFEHKKSSLELEMTDMTTRIQISTTALSQLQEQVEAKQKLLQTSMSEIRTNERRLDELRRLIRSEELRFEEIKNCSKSLEIEIDSSQRELSLLRAQVDETKLQISAQKAVLNDCCKAIEEKKRLLEQLREDESLSRDNSSKANFSLTKLNEQVREMQMDLRNLQISQEKEKQQLKELQSTKFFLQSEINRLNAELSNGNEYAVTKYSQKQEMENSLKKLIDEQSLFQKRILAAKAELDELKNRQEDLRLNEDSLKMAHSRIMSELELARDLKEKEESILSKLKREFRETTNSLNKTKQELNDRIEELQKKQVEMEGLNSSYQNLHSLKTHEQEEIKKLRDQKESEAKKAAATEVQVSQLEEKLKFLKEEIHKTEEIYERRKSQSWEESRKIELQRRALEQSAAELIEMGNTLQQSEKEIQDRKQRSVLEIGHLNSLRQSTQQQLMQLLMAKEMVDPISSVKPEKFRPLSVPFSNQATMQKSRVVDIDITVPFKKDDNNTSFTTISDSDQDEVEKLAFTSLQQAVEHLRQQSNTVLQGR